MDISKYQSGIKIGTDRASVYINPESEIDSGVVIYTAGNVTINTNEERLVIEGPGEYEYQGIYIKGIRKNGIISFTLTYDERKVFFTESEGILSIPEDDFFDAVIIAVAPDFDESKIIKISYPTVYLDNGNVLVKTEPEIVKNINLKKITPGERNIFKLS